MTDTFRKEYKELGEKEVQQMNDIKVKAQELYDLIGVVESAGKSGREVACAKTKLEECVMWAVKAVTA